MGLDKRKKILLVDDFKINAFNDINMQLSNVQQTSLPTNENDVLLDKNENVHYSVQNILNKLLDNDKFIQTYLSKLKQIVNVSNRLSNDLSSSITFEQISASINSISGIYQKYLNDHINEYHINKYHINANNNDDFCSLSTVAQDYLKTDMSNFDEYSAAINFQKKDSPNNLGSSKDITISNDVVIDIEFDDDENVRDPLNYINVQVSNKNTNNQFQTNLSKQITTFETLPDLTQCKYIYKKWLSGFKELYIYIPTTFTTYNEHLPNQYGKENPHENATTIRVGINRRHFKFNHIYQANICGQSLPMQIHANNNPYFSDIILPSMLRSMCVSNGLTNNTEMIYDEFSSMYYLYFTCYGTDAQAIRIYGD